MYPFLKKTSKIPRSFKDHLAGEPASTTYSASLLRAALQSHNSTFPDEEACQQTGSAPSAPAAHSFTARLKNLISIPLFSSLSTFIEAKHEENVTGFLLESLMLQSLVQTGTLSHYVSKQPAKSHI